MRAAEIPEFTAFPTVHAFVGQVVDLHLADLRLMMLTTGYNFASAALLCNIVSGIAESIFKPRTQWRMRDGRRQRMHTGDRFLRLLWNYYPWERGERPRRDANRIYQYLRNPFAHSLGLQDDHGYAVLVGKTGLRGNHTWQT